MSVERLTTALADRYRIERELGQGGMATVYLAYDVRHDRKVALKVLRPELAAILGGERFLHEIRTTANLQHPHILSLFDSGEADGLVYYVMPYVDGESLRDRLNREKQLPVDDAVRIGREVADALEYAHQHGIVHRDIKPENILLHGGHAMVADFGIALAASRSDGGTRMTETGMSLGTPHYMAPEQAMGEREITPKADIYALGCVLYEMLTAEPPFVGATAQAIIARVMTEEPRSLTLQRRTIPPHVEAAVRTALEKLPADRFASAAQFAEALGRLDYAMPVTRQGRAAAAPRSPRDRALAALPWVLLVLVGGGAAWSALRPRPGAAVPPISRFGLELPAEASWLDQTGAGVALSPDGSVLAYNGRDSSSTQLYLRRIDRLDPVAVPGSQRAFLPAFSADGRWLAFRSGSKILRAPVAGGPAESVCDLSDVRGLTWLGSDAIVTGSGRGLVRCAISGAVDTLLAADSAATVYWPDALPGGRAILYTVRRGPNDRLAALDLRTKIAKPIEISGSNPHYVNAGYLVYASLDGAIRAVPFDTAQLKPTGEPVVVVQNVRVGSGGAAKLALSSNGLMISAGGRAGQTQLVMVDRHGVTEPLYQQIQRYLNPAVSPDGRRVAVAAGDAPASIWLLDRVQRTLTRLSFDSAASQPAWSPDGRRIVYVRTIGARADLRIINADGSAPAESLLTLPMQSLFQAFFAPDGRSLVVRTTGGPGNRDIWRIAMDTPGVLKPVLNSPSDEVTPSLSPDGRWMAYSSNESGHPEVYVRSFPTMGARYQVSLDGGLDPIWSRDGREIFYRAGAAFLAAAVRTSPSFDILGRSMLFADPSFQGGSTARYFDVMPDGQHFVMVRDLTPSVDLIVTMNWFQNLKAGMTGASGMGGQ